jgi:predicted transcriptional regulator
MKTVTLDVRSLNDNLADFANAWKTGQAEDSARISFTSPELLWKVLTAKRWALLQAMTGQEPMTLREAARRVSRDVKAVHADIHALLNAGIVRRNDANKLVFPFDAVRVEFMLNAA